MSTNGAIDTSLGQRPRSRIVWSIEGQRPGLISDPSLIGQLGRAVGPGFDVADSPGAWPQAEMEWADGPEMHCCGSLLPDIQHHDGPTPVSGGSLTYGNHHGTHTGSDSIRSQTWGVRVTRGMISG